MNVFQPTGKGGHVRASFFSLSLVNSVIFSLLVSFLITNPNSHSMAKPFLSHHSLPLEQTN